MSAIRNIAKNTLALTISQVASMLLGFLYMMYMARYLGAGGFGILSTAIAFTGILSVFNDLGLSILATREVARDRSAMGRYLGNIAAMKSVLITATLLLIAVSATLLGYPQQTVLAIFIIAISNTFVTLTSMFNAMFQAYETMSYQSIGYTISSILMLAGVLIAISLGFGVIGFALVYLATNLIVFIYSISVFILKFHMPRLEINIQIWKPLLAESLPFGMTTIFTMIFYWVDSVLLSMMQGVQVVGWYSAAYRLTTSLLFIPFVFNTTLFPVLARSFVVSQDAFNLAFMKYFKYMAIMGIPLGVGSTILASQFIMLIYGSGYANSTIALQVLIWSVVFTFLCGPFTRVIETANRQALITKITGVLMVENILMNLILIPWLSHVGASIAAVLTMLTSLILNVIVCDRIGYRLDARSMADLAKVVISSLVMGIYLVAARDLNLLLLVASSMIIYFISLYLLKTFDVSDINIIKGILAIKMGRRADIRSMDTEVSK